MLRERVNTRNGNKSIASHCQRSSTWFGIQRVFKKVPRIKDLGIREIRKMEAF